MNRRQTPSPLLAAIAAGFCLSLAACGGGNGEAPPAGPVAPQVAAAPVITITNNVSAEVATGPILFSFSFNRDVGTSFTTEDVSVSGGSKGAFTRLSGTSATLLVLPTPESSGTVQLTVPAGAVTDALGTPNVATSAQKAFNTIAPVLRTPLVSFDEATPPRLLGFGGAEAASIVTDPVDGANKVARVVKSAQAELWAGTTVATCPNDGIAVLPFSSTLRTLSLRVWSPVAGIPVRLKVEDSTDGSRSVETEATVTAAGSWQTLNFNFAAPAPGTPALNPAHSYDKASVFFNFGTPGAATGERVYLFDDLSFVGSSFTPACRGQGGGATPATASIDFESATAPSLAGFGGAEEASVVSDPTDAANKVARIVKSAAAELWAGTTISTEPGNTIRRIGFASGSTTISARVWSPVAGIPVRIKVEDAADGAVSVETEATVTTAAGWQTLNFNFANQVPGTPALNLAATYNRLSVFFDFGTPGSAVGAARTYFIDDIVYPLAGGGSGGSTGPGATGTVVFASGFTSNQRTAQGGEWGYFSGDFSSVLDTFTGGGFANSTPPLADDAQFFFIAVTTSAPTAPAGNPPNSGGFLGMYVTHPGLRLNGQTQLAVNLGVDASFINQAGNKNIDVFVVGATAHGNGSGGECRVTLRGSITPTSNAMITYTLPLASMTLVQPCNGGGFNSGVTTLQQALAQPIGAVNTQFSFPNLNTTINSGTAAAPVYATGITRGKTEFR